ncbi:hypothetical protein MYX84_11815 [Acidobacteria bacterium AH-259-O06]|nr:hypothetical protein [Acidobacteria bacterium AH-259-O06]
MTKLNDLLDQDRVALAVPVWIELLSGVSGKQLPRFRRLLSALPLYTPSEQAWSLIEGWVTRSRARGQGFGVADLLIASIVAQNQGEIWSLDEDFTRMSKLGFVTCYAP